MSDDKIKSLLMDLNENLNKAVEIIKQINVNSVEERDNNKYDAPRVLGVMVSWKGTDPTDLKTTVQITNAFEVIGEPVTTTVRESKTYRTEKSVNVNGVKYFDLV